MDRAHRVGEPVTADAVDPARVARARRCLDDAGRLQRWPSKRSEQMLVVWMVWSQIPADTQFSESDVRAMLRGWHDYEDHALLRREMVDMGLMQRTPTGSVYRRANPDVPAEAAAAIATLA
jgi:hypothetical protein